MVVDCNHTVPDQEIGQLTCHDRPRWIYVVCICISNPLTYLEYFYYIICNAYILFCIFICSAYLKSKQWVTSRCV